MRKTFGKVQLGGQFTSWNMGRSITCVKMHKTNVGTNEIRNAVLIFDRNHQPAQAAGALLFFENDVPVELEVTKTGEEWAAQEGRKILDPDGWREASISFADTLIDERAYQLLKHRSTIAA